MLAALAAAGLASAASLALGQAILAIAGWREWSWLAPGVGLAALLTIVGLAAKLPGRATTAAAIAGGLSVASVVFLVAAGRGRGAGRAALRGLAPASIAAAAAALPFVANDRVGILGAGLVNDDMANHLLMADWVLAGTEPTPELVEGGYPLGPHSVAAALADALGTGLVEAFAGLTIAIAALGALVALAVLERLPPVRRTVAAALAALPYLAAAYLAQGAFKEPIQALLLVAFVLVLAEATRRAGGAWPGRANSAAPGVLLREAAVGRTSASGVVAIGVPLGVIAAGAVFNYSFPGLFWLAGAAALYAGLTAAARVRPSVHAAGRSVRSYDASTAVRRGAAVLGATLAVAAIFTLPDWSRIADFASFEAFDPAGDQTGLGNLRQPISPLEALGIWPSGEFRSTPASATLPAAAFYLGGVLGGLALAAGLLRAITARRWALPAAVGAAAAIYAGATVAGTPYTSAKALAIAAPPIMLISLWGLLAPDRLLRGRRPGASRSRGGRAGRAALAGAFVVAAAGSSFLVLRAAPVSPSAHASELAEIRPLVRGEPVLFLGRDDFIAWHLRGAPVSTHLLNFFNTGRVPARIDPGGDEEKFGFDAVSPDVLDRFPWVLTTRTAYASQPPASFEAARSTPSYVLWRRQGPTPARETLAEGAAPGALLACDRPARTATDGQAESGLPGARPATAAVWERAPNSAGEIGWRPSATIAPGQTASQTLRLAAGRWQLSLAYDSPRTLEAEVSSAALTGEAFDASDLTLPANLDFRGPTPHFKAGTIHLERPAQVSVDVTLAPAPWAGRLLGAEGEAHLRGLAVAPVSDRRSDAPWPVPTRRRALADSCGEYVDWYR